MGTSVWFASPNDQVFELFLAIFTLIFVYGHLVLLSIFYHVINTIIPAEKRSTRDFHGLLLFYFAIYSIFKRRQGSL